MRAKATGRHLGISEQLQRIQMLPYYKENNFKDLTYLWSKCGKNK